MRDDRRMRWSRFGFWGRRAPSSEAGNRGREGRTQPPLPRAWRRRAVVAIYGGYATVVGLFWLNANADLPLWTGVLPLLAGLVMLFGVSAILFGQGHPVDLANQTDEVLDERERQVRDRAFRFAYMGLAAAFTLLAVYGAMAADSGLGWLPSTWNERQAVTWGVFLLAWTLPTAVVAWTEPDPVRDER